MVTPLTIREATAADDHAIGELLIQAFVDTYRRKMPEVVVTESRIADLRNVASKRNDGAVLVCDLYGELCGTVTLLPATFDASRLWDKRLSELRYLAVRHDQKGKGISKALLRAAERVALQWGSEGIGLHVRRGAEGVARFYREDGYVRMIEGDVDRTPEVFLEAYLKIIS